VSGIFELIAMIARSFHLPGSRFRRLPNPCATSWTTGFDFASCLTHFATAFKNNTSLGSHVLVKEIHSIFFRNGLPNSVMVIGDETLTQKLSSYSKSKKEFEDFEHGIVFWPGDDWEAKKGELEAQFGKDFLDLLDSLHGAIECVDELLLNKIEVNTGRAVKEILAVKEVLALHFAALFDRQEELNGQLAEFSLEDPEEKILINFYFDKIHPAVVVRVQEYQGGRVSTPGGAVDEKSAIWVALVFRMLVWLVLHDFDPEDTMIERSEFMNSRLPVYIG
jgi:hypothetical protein